MGSTSGRRWVPDMLKSVLLFAGLAYAGLLLAMYLTQSSLFFLPKVGGRALAATPEAIGLEFRALEIPTEDGETLDAWLVPTERSRGTVLFFHGNAGNISHRLDTIAVFHELDLDLLIFDYRGYGRSTGSPSESGTYLDARAAWRYLVLEQGVAPQQILLFGRSLGGAVAVGLAAETRPGGLVVESSFTSVPDLAAELYPWLPVRWLSRIHYESKRRIRQVEMPLLVIHSAQDEIIPFSHGRALFEAANPPKWFLELEGGHNDGFLRSRTRYVAGIRRFLDQVLRLE